MNNVSIDRRGFLIGTAGLSLSAAAFARSRKLTPETIRVASNQGIENATIQQLMTDRGFARDLALDIALIPSKEISGPLDALVNDTADICMVSAFAGVLPAIEQGKPVRLVGTALQLPAAAVYSARPDIRRVEDLAGRSVGIGGKLGLLHIMMIALLRKKGVSPESVRFVSVGSNAEVLKAVADGRVDAGPSGIAGLSDHGPVHVLAGGQFWKDLPEFTYQPAYASVQALRERPEAVARCLAAYTRLFRFISAPESDTAYLAARAEAGGDASEGREVWEFTQRNQPYPRLPGISPAHVAFLQQLNVAVGLQQHVLPYDQVADPRPAARARRLLA